MEEELAENLRGEKPEQHRSLLTTVLLRLGERHISTLREPRRVELPASRNPEQLRSRVTPLVRKRELGSGRVECD